MPRRLPGGIIDSPEQAAEQALRFAQEGITVTTAGGSQLVPIDTLCVHGDSPHAVQVLRAIRARLAEHGLAVAALASAPRAGA